jgi:hypothetical protein
MEKINMTFLPSEEWREKYEKQATEKMLERLHRAARARLRTFAGRGGHVDTADIEDVVSTVLKDTLSGKLKWDPDKEPLEDNLLDAVRFRVRDRWQRDQRRKHDSIDEDERDRGIVDEAAPGAVVPASSAPSERDRRIKLVFDEVVTALRPMCVDKPEVLRLLGLYMQGITDRDEVMLEGMNKVTYHNARRCLGRLVLNLPAQLRDAAVAALNT